MKFKVKNWKDIWEKKGEMNMEASNCCGAKPIYELDENMGYCSECGRGAVFQEEEE